jgi:hypothetical protein
MRSVPLLAGITALVLAPLSAAFADQDLDIRRAVPTDAYLALYAKHNPERDFQREHFENVWETVQQTRILPRLLEIVTENAPAEDMERANAVIAELKEAAAPIDFQEILNCKEMVYAQFMNAERIPTAQHLFVLHLTEQAAQDTAQGLKNLLALIEGYSDGEVKVVTSEVEGVQVATLGVPREVPFQPTVARAGDMVLISSSDLLMKRSLENLLSDEGDSKFDDPRLQEALKKLPEPEDTLVFYDMEAQFSEMRKMGDFIRAVSNGDPEAERIIRLIDMIFHEVSILEYEVTVEYTEGNLNRTVAYGQAQADYADKVLGKMFSSGEMFENWQSWVPQDAVAYSLNSGVTLLPLYEKVMEVLENDFPESAPVLDQLEELETKFDVRLDRDLLGAFSGESVSVSLPSSNPAMLGGQDSFLALRCRKPERVKELLHRLVDAIKETPVGKTQQVALVESDELEGFEELSVLSLAPFQVQPTIGFRDGWMMIGSNPQAIQRVLAARAGEGATITESEAFQRFQLEVEGSVAAISYTDLAATTRQISSLITQAGMAAPFIVAMAGANADPEEMKPIQELLSLLPSVARIVGKFDFLEASLSVTQDGDAPNTYVRRTVTVVRPLDEEEETDQQQEQETAAAAKVELDDD